MYKQQHVKNRNLASLMNEEDLFFRQDDDGILQALSHRRTKDLIEALSVVLTQGMEWKCVANMANT